MKSRPTIQLIIPKLFYIINLIALVSLFCSSGKMLIKNHWKPFYPELLNSIYSHMNATQWKTMKEGIYEVVLLSFPFMSFGLISGAIWANEIWGGYWSWDIKEIWSLITWLLYIAFFHCRFSKTLSHWAIPLQIAAFLALLFTLFMVSSINLGATMHSYAN